MEFMQIAICDDDVFAQNLIEDAIRNLLQKEQIVCKIKTFSSAKELRIYMMEKKFDLLLLDIDMPEMDGITLGKWIRKKQMENDIIFISNREDKVFESLKIHPVGFIRKRYFLEDIPSVINTYLKYREKEKNRIIIKTRNGTLAIEVDKILYIEGQRKHQLIYLEDKKTVEVNYSMKELEEELTPYGFLRCHKGYIVNYKRIYLFSGADIILDTGETIPVSRRKELEIKEKYMIYVQEEGDLIL